MSVVSVFLDSLSYFSIGFFSSLGFLCPFFFFRQVRRVAGAISDDISDS